MLCCGISVAMSAGELSESWESFVFARPDAEILRPDVPAMGVSMNNVPTRPERAALQTVHQLADARIALASPQSSWTSVAATRFRMRRVDVTLPALGVPAYGVNYGQHMKLRRTLNGRTVGASAGAGQLSLLPPDAPTRWVFDQPGDVALVFLRGDVFDRAIAEGPGRGRGAVEIAPEFAIRDLVLERIAHQLLKEISEPGPASRLLTEELAEELAGHLIFAHSNIPQRQGSPHAIAPSKLKRAAEFMWSSMHSELSLADIADAAGMSLFHFAKAFKQATGQAPHQYLTAQRMLQARALLHDRKLSVGQVAGSVGLSHSHFTDVFRRQMGMTPTKFRDVLSS
jgi:AraC family transcriptional regulator